MAYQSKRPLSPHLQVYKLPLAAKTSILHRASGYGLSVGTVMVVWFLVAAATGAAAYDTAMNFVSSPVGTVLMFGWSFALFYHMCNGIRHLIWDMGYLLDIRNTYRASCAVLLAATVLTIGVWAYAGGWFK